MLLGSLFLLWYRLADSYVRFRLGEVIAGVGDVVLALSLALRDESTPGAPAPLVPIRPVPHVA